MKMMIKLAILIAILAKGSFYIKELVKTEAEHKNRIEQVIKELK